MTTALSQKAYIIRIEDLNVSGMIANHKLANAISNKGAVNYHPAPKTLSSCEGLRPLLRRYSPDKSTFEL